MYPHGVQVLCLQSLSSNLISSKDNYTTVQAIKVLDLILQIFLQCTSIYAHHPVGNTDHDVQAHP